MAALIRSELCAAAAYRLLARQGLGSIYSLGFFDMRKIEVPGVIVDSFERFCEISGVSLAFDGLGATIIYRGRRIILYRESAPGGARRLNWTIAHEVGHALLCHAESTRLSEAEADVFAAELLMPEPAIRVLDAFYGYPLSPGELTAWFNVSRVSAERRRAELDRRPSIDSPAAAELIKRLFPEHIFAQAGRILHKLSPLCEA